MKPSTRAETPLATAAEAFEHELSRYERISLELKRTTVTSQKSLHRTQKLLSDSAESEEALGVQLQGLLQAMNGAREKQQSCMEWALAAAQALQTRATSFNELLSRVSTLGERAREVGQPIATIVSEKAQGASADQLLSRLNALSEQMLEIVTEANAIERTATDDQWPEIAKDVRSLRQQVQSAHAKVVSSCQDVGSHASS